MSDSEPCVAGTVFRDLRWALGEIAGREAVEHAEAMLDDEHRQTLAEATPLTWVPMAALGAVIDGTAAHARLDAEAMLDEAVRRATAKTFKTVWRIFLRFTSDAALVKRTPALYAKSRNVGRLEVVSIERGRADLALASWPDVTDRHIRTLAVNIETVVRLAGRQDVHCDGRRTPDGARYELTWSA